MQKKILIIDDNNAVNTSLELLLKQAGYFPASATTPKKALNMLGSEDFDLILQDMNFSRSTTGEEGIQLLKDIKKSDPRIPVVLITAWGSISLAVRGIREGASDFITKPWTNEQILQSVRTALGLAAAAPVQKDKVISRKDLDSHSDFSGIIGNDPKFLQILDIISRISRTDASVLITGESGTGKELIAEAIHKNSERIERPFIKVNLGGISTSLFESEMFGHVKGAFTDAKSSRKGRFELADGGTIFLDEIGDLELDSQVKLLRVLQDRTYEVLGSSTTRKVDVRVISATNRNLNEMVEKGEFREDLLYRLNLIAIHIPPLRERIDDIPHLSKHFLSNIGKVYRRHELGINDLALNWLMNQPFPGNIRQLRQLIERTVLLTNNNTLEVEDFNLAVRMQPDQQDRDRISDIEIMPLDEMEKSMILRSLDHYNGNISRIAEALGLSRAALYRRFEKFGIKL